MDYSNYVTTSTTDPASTGFLAGVGTGTIIVYLLLIVFYLVCMWKIYEKAGEPGWAAIVPIYNTIVLLRFLKMDWWHILIMIFVPFAALVYSILFQFKLAKAFGKGVGFGFLLLLIPIVGYPMLAFGSAKYEG